MAERDHASWFPFRAVEVEIALGVFGFVATAAAFAGVEERLIACVAVLYLALAYIAGLLVHAQDADLRFAFVRDGSLGGHGYLERFRGARRSLFLMHLDDDRPGPELQGLYRTLLDRGVEIRRVLFLRSKDSTGSLDWVAEFGNHENLRQRVVLPEQGRLMRLCFVLVDASEVLIAVPGYEPVDAAPFAARFLLRHLLIILDRNVAAAFIGVYEQIWRSALPLDDAGLLREPEALEERLRAGIRRR